MEQTKITIRVPIVEKQIIDSYSEQVGRTYTDLLREFIRSLESKIDRASSKSVSS